jgi:hypothetical protein
MFRPLMRCLQGSAAACSFRCVIGPSDGSWFQAFLLLKEDDPKTISAVAFGSF